MPDFQLNTGFEPSREALTLWLGTRKKPYGEAGTTLPGMYQTFNFAADKTAFYCALAAEVIGMALIVQSFRGHNKTGIIAFSILIVVLDLLFARLRHQNEYLFCLVENRKFFAPELLDKQLLEEELIWPKRWRKVYTICICAIAVLKIIAFILLKRHNMPDIATVLIVLCYVFTASVHIYSTGYYIWEVWTQFKIDKDYQLFLKTSASAKISKEVQVANAATKHFETINTKEIKRVEIDKHRLEADAANHFKFSIDGILLDKQLTAFASKQNREQKKVVFETGLRLQLAHYGGVLIDTLEVAPNRGVLIDTPEVAPNGGVLIDTPEVAPNEGVLIDTPKVAPKNDSPQV
jgi:DNA-binding protein